MKLEKLQLKELSIQELTTIDVGVKDPGDGTGCIPGRTQAHLITS